MSFSYFWQVVLCQYSLWKVLSQSKEIQNTKLRTNEVNIYFCGFSSSPYLYPYISVVRMTDSLFCVGTKLLAHLYLCDWYCIKIHIATWVAQAINFLKLYVQIYYFILMWTLFLLTQIQILLGTQHSLRNLIFCSKY